MHHIFAWAIVDINPFKLMIVTPTAKTTVLGNELLNVRFNYYHFRDSYFCFQFYELTWTFNNVFIRKFHGKLEGVWVNNQNWNFFDFWYWFMRILNVKPLPLQAPLISHWYFPFFIGFLIRDILRFLIDFTSRVLWFLWVLGIIFILIIIR